MTAPVAVDPAPPDLATELERLAAAAAADPDRPLLLVGADLQVHPQALADLAEDPRDRTAALVSTGAGGPVDLRVRAGRVVGAASPVHRVDVPDTAFAGALRLAAADRAAVAGVARDLAVLARRQRWTGDPLAYLLLGLVRRDVVVGTVALDPWPWARGCADRALQDRLDALGPDEVHHLRLARATKADDGVVATLLSRPLSRRLTPYALRLGLSPNQVTAGSVLLGLAAAGLFALGSTASLVAGAVLLQVSFVLDCVDGEVARYRRAFTATGAWLDASTDRLKEFACYGGLAWGASAGRAGWLLAALMLTLQTARHTLDYTFTAVKELREADVVTAALDDPGEPPGPAGGDRRAVRAIELSRRAGSRAGVTVLKKLLHLGIGERWLVLSVLAALGLPVAALGTLLALGLVSLGYTSAGRTLRTRSWPPLPVQPREREIVRAQVDAGPLVPAAVVDRVAGAPGTRSRWLWARPPLLRLTEYAALLALTAALPGAPAGAAVFLLLLVVASHHYDDLYRVLQRLRPPPRAARTAGLGSTGRLLAVALLVLAGGGVAGLWVLAAALGILFLVAEPARVLREVRSRHDLDPTGAAGA